MKISRVISFCITIVLFLQLTVIAMSGDIGGYVLGKASFGEEISVLLPNFKVTLNGQRYINEYSKYPFIVYKNITYMPLTWNIMKYLGVKMTVHELSAENPRSNIDYAVAICKGEKTMTELDSDVKSKMNVSDLNARIYKKYVAVQSYHKNNDTEYPLLFMNDIYYLPITWNYAYNLLGWNYSFDDENGLVINTEKVVRPILEDEIVAKSLSNVMSVSTYRMNYIYSHDFYIAHTFNVGRLYVVDASGQSNILDMWEDEQFKNLDLSMIYKADSSPQPPSFDNEILTFYGVCKNGTEYSFNAKISINVENKRLISVEEVV